MALFRALGSVLGRSRGRKPGSPHRKPSANFVRDAAIIKAQLRERQQRRRCVIVPSGSTFLPIFDGLIFLALAYTAIFTPFEVSFLPQLTDSRAWFNPRFIINRIVDVMFCLDALLQFFIAYEEKKHHEDEGGGDAVPWVVDHRRIALNYCRTWLLFDVVTIGVSAFDIAPTFQALRTSASQVFAARVAVGGSDGLNLDASNLTILRVLRTLRLIKLVRLARVSRIYSRWESAITLTYGTQTMIRCFFRLILAAHWYACIFALQAAMHADPNNTWMGNEMYMTCHTLYPPPPSPTAPPPPPPPSWNATKGFETPTAAPPVNDPLDAALIDSLLPNDCEHLGVGTWYLAAFSWSTMIITGTGGTDFYPSYRSHVETAIVCIFVISGALIWTNILALFCDVATNSHPGMVLYRQTVDELNSFIESNEVPPHLALRLREYLHQQRALQIRHSTSKVVESLSPSLQVETVLFVHKKWLKKVWFLARIEQACLVQVAMAMSELVFAPSELAPRRALYVVRWGVVLHGGRVLTSGKLWGEDMILSEEAYTMPYVARMMTYVGAMHLSRECLFRIVSHFPMSFKALRRSAAHLALHRHLVRAAREHQKSGVVKKAAKQGFAGIATLHKSSRDLRDDGSRKDLLDHVSSAANKQSTAMLAEESSEGSGMRPEETVVGPFKSNMRRRSSTAADPLMLPGRWPAAPAAALPGSPSNRASSNGGNTADEYDAKVGQRHRDSMGMARMEDRVDSLDQKLSGLSLVCERLSTMVESIDRKLADPSSSSAARTPATRLGPGALSRPPRRGRPDVTVVI